MAVQDPMELEQGTTTIKAVGCDVVSRFAYGRESTQASVGLQLVACDLA